NQKNVCIFIVLNKKDINMKELQKFSTSNFSYNKELNSFIAEASEVAFPGFLKNFILVNPKTKNQKTFTFVKSDKDSSGEDTYGWRYKTECGISALIIND